MSLNKTLTIAYYIGMILLFIGIIMHINENPLSFWIFTLGVIPLLGVRIFNFIIGKPENKRKHAILVFSGIALALTAAAIFMDKSYWVILLAISAVLDLYISFRKFT